MKGIRSDGNGGYIIDKKHIYLTLPAVIAIIIFISNLVSAAVTTNNKVDQLSEVMEKNQVESRENAERLRVLENQYGVINTKLDAVIKNQEKLDDKIEIMKNG